MSDALKLRQVRSLIDDLIETTREESKETVDSLRQQLASQEIVKQGAIGMLNSMNDELRKQLTKRDRAIARLEKVVTSWIRANGPGGWIDDMRQQLADLRASKSRQLQAVNPSYKEQGK